MWPSVKNVISGLLKVAASAELLVDNGRHDKEDLLVVVFHAQRDQLPFEILLEECEVLAGCLRVLL